MCTSVVYTSKSNYVTIYFYGIDTSQMECFQVLRIRNKEKSGKLEGRGVRRKFQFS